ncbi:hypothetical protein GQ457_01G034210 [Hibiscus cannabinus]
MDERMLKNKRKKTWRCDVGLKTTRDRKVITCSWIKFWNTEFTYGSISFDEKDLMLVMEGHATWIHVPNVQKGVFSKKDLDKYNRRKDNTFEQYQHALKVERDNSLAWRKKMRFRDRDEIDNEVMRIAQNTTARLKASTREARDLRSYIIVSEKLKPRLKPLLD